LAVELHQVATGLLLASGLPAREQQVGFAPLYAFVIAMQASPMLQVHWQILSAVDTLLRVEHHNKRWRVLDRMAAVIHMPHCASCHAPDVNGPQRRLMAECGAAIGRCKLGSAIAESFS
jgi:hypothetical protein